MVARALAAILALLALAGIVWAGIGFAAFALASFLTNYIGWPGAAAATGFLLLFPPVLAILLIGRRMAAARRRRRANSILNILARMAAERPLVALVGAALLGVADALLGSRRKREKD